MGHRLERRGLLTAGVALAGAAIGGPAAAAAMAATPRNELGPFYRREAPNAAALARGGDVGMPLSLAGGVFRTTGETLAGAQIELWHADDAGHYDVSGDRFRARLVADGKGGYGVATIMPGHYPDRVCQHIHFLVRAPGCKPLVTQLYFATDPVFEGDPDRNFNRDPLIVSRELVRPVTLVAKDGVTRAHCAFDLVLEAV